MGELVAAGAHDVTFTVIGPDEGEGARLRQLATQLGVAGHVRWRGPADPAELASAAAAATFFVQLSDYEGRSLAVIEAMRAGLIPVVTPVGDIPRYTADHVDAVHVGADLRATAARIAAIARDDERTRRMRAAAVARWTEATPLRRQLLDVCAHALAP